MLAKELFTVVAFSNTTSALAMEAACKKHNIPGRIIPVPNQITKACGFAWRVEADKRQTIEEFIKEENLDYKGIYDLEL